MRLVTFTIRTKIGRVSRIGALRNGDREIVDLNSAYRWLAREKGNPRPEEEAAFFVPPDMLDFLRGEEQSMAAARDALRLLPDGQVIDGAQTVFDRATVRLMAPVPRPVSVREFSEWHEHAKNFRPGPKPRYFHFAPSHAYNANVASFVGPEDDLVLPSFTDAYDLEPELGFYIGRKGTNIQREDANRYIAGFTLFIDPSARDVQTREGMALFKSKDFTYSAGPCIVTPDEFDETRGTAWVRLNGELVWQYEIGHLRRFWSPDLVAFASDSEMLHPGDFFGIGTIGTGAKIDSGISPKEGDLYEFGIDTLGMLRQRVTLRQGSDLVRSGISWGRQRPTFTGKPEDER